MDVRFCLKQEPSAERQRCAAEVPGRNSNALSRARKAGSCFLVDKDLHGGRLSGHYPVFRVLSGLPVTHQQRSIAQLSYSWACKVYTLEKVTRAQATLNKRLS